METNKDIQALSAEQIDEMVFTKGIQSYAYVDAPNDWRNFIRELIATRQPAPVASAPAVAKPVAIRWPDGRGRHHYAGVDDTVTQNTLESPELEYLYISPQPAAAPVAADVVRYQRLRILGVAPFGTPQLENGTVLRFQNLDAFVDSDLEQQPSRGEAQPPADAAPGWDADATTRLRSIVDLLGLQSCMPEGDLTGYEFAVLGFVRMEIERLKAKADAAPVDAEPWQWAPGPDEFKDWCTQYFGPDSDESYLADAVFNLPLMAQRFKRSAAPQYLAHSVHLLEQVMRPYGIYDVAVSNAGALALDFIEIGKAMRKVIAAQPSTAQGDALGQVASARNNMPESPHNVCRNIEFDLRARIAELEAALAQCASAPGDALSQMAGDDLPPNPEMEGPQDIPYVLNTPADWDADYRSIWERLQVAERNKMQWRGYALQLRAALEEIATKAAYSDCPSIASAALAQRAASQQDNRSGALADLNDKKFYAWAKEHNKTLDEKCNKNYPAIALDGSATLTAGYLAFKQACHEAEKRAYKAGWHDSAAVAYKYQFKNPMAPSQPDSKRDAALEALMVEHRIGVMPEYEGGFNAEIYGDDEVPQVVRHGRTPSEAVAAAMAAQERAKHE